MKKPYNKTGGNKLLALSESAYQIRKLNDDDRSNYGEMVHTSFNSWYWKKGWGRDYFQCSPQEATVFYDIYNDLSPGSSFAAVCNDTGKLMGSCFYHPRELHVSLGIMAVHPAYGGKGVGRALVNEIVHFTESNNYKALRLVSSAINMDSFSLYNRAGLVPRVSLHDMIISVPLTGMTDPCPMRDRVRNATLQDVKAMGDLEMSVSGIRREIDYKYAIENPRDCLHATVIENPAGGLDGFMIGVKNAALNMLGPCVAKTEEAALGMLHEGLDRYKGEVVLFLVPMEKRLMVETLYGWGGLNVETHLFQVRGEYKPFEGVNMPSFLPETG